MSLQSCLGLSRVPLNELLNPELLKRELFLRLWEGVPYTPPKRDRWLKLSVDATLVKSTGDEMWIAWSPGVSSRGGLMGLWLFEGLKRELG